MGPSKLVNGKRSTVAVVVTCAALAFAAASAQAGSLTPPAAPAEAGSAMFTIGDVYQRLSDGTAGTKTTDQAAIDAWRTKGRQVGIYGDLTIRRATPAETAWVTAAEAAYHAARTPIALEDGDMFSD